jgi:hypothetical protein
MSSTHGDWDHESERLLEQGRVLWLLGRGLRRAKSKPSGLGAWAVAALDELKTLEQGEQSQGAAATRQKPRVSKAASLSTDGSIPIVVWIASCSRHGEWTTLAVGIDEDGQKRVLAVLDGATNDPLVCEGILAELATAGLRGSEPVLVITDGSLTLDDTLHLRWNGPYVLAHCRIAVRHAVLSHLQGAARERVESQLGAAWNTDDPDKAESILRKLVKNLEQDHPGAADRLQRSLEPSLAVSRLKVPSPLKEHLVIAGTARVAFDRAIGWGGEDKQAMQSGLAEWLRRTRRPAGFQALPELLGRLGRKSENPTEKEQAASQSLPSTTQPTL